MKAVIGYLLAGIGLIGLAVNSTIGREELNFLEGISSEYILVPSAVFIAAGVIVMILTGKSKGGKIKHVTEEVPIYQGTGKKRKIVGYRVE
tara:strand:+ start:508 stop:780 length:273 start_codon:yes stop_codon:yes gene_type:complete